MSTTIPEIPQKYYEDNRKRFEAETTIAPIELKKCKHRLVRKDATTIECSKCRNGWLFTGQIPEAILKEVDNPKTT